MSDGLKKFITDNNIVDLGCGDFRCGKLIYDDLDIQNGDWRQLSCEYLPLKKFNPIKLYNYHSKEVCVIEIKTAF